MATYKVGYIIGSLAKASINRKLAKALIRAVARRASEFVEIPIRDLPLYSYDYDADFPRSRRRSRRPSSPAEACLFVTPEYNRSLPGALKNAIDWASRPTARIHSRTSPRPSSAALPARSAPRSPSSSLRSILSFCNSPQMNCAGGLHPVHEGHDRR